MRRGVLRPAARLPPEHRSAQARELAREARYTSAELDLALAQAELRLSDLGELTAAGRQGVLIDQVRRELLLASFLRQRRERLVRQLNLVLGSPVLAPQVLQLIECLAP